MNHTPGTAAHYERSKRFSIAPMMACTDRHARYLMRCLSKHALLYTEMVTTGAIIYGDVPRHLNFHEVEHPIAAQLGGSNPDELAQSARVVESYGYDEVNLNVGCPSDAVQRGCFGAALMARPELVADCVRAMRDAVGIPVTVKCRIGIDDLDSYDHLHGFITIVANAGCDTFIIHARKAWLKGLSPKQNRELPPLRYDVVHRLNADFPEIQFMLNGGLKTLAQVEEQANGLAGAMMGREAYGNPYILADVDEQVFGVRNTPPSRRDVVRQMHEYLRGECAKGTRASHVLRHMLGLFQGTPGARQWRRTLSAQMHEKGAGPEVLDHALAALDETAAIVRSAA